MDSRSLLAALQHADSFFAGGAVSFSWGARGVARRWPDPDGGRRCVVYRGAVPAPLGHWRPAGIGGSARCRR